MDVLGYLNSKPQFTYKFAGPNNIHTNCFYCGEDPQRRGRLYINVDPSMTPPGLFHCHLCGEQGAFNKIRKHFGDPPLDDDGNPFIKGASKDTTSSNKLAILKASVEYYHDQLLDNEVAFDWLRDGRGLTATTIQDKKLGWADGGLGGRLKSLGFTQQEITESNLIKKDGSDFFVNRIIIPYFVNGHVIQIRGKDMNGKYFTAPGESARPYNIDSVRGAKSVIITEGEFDALVVEQLGYATVGVPGANSWQESWNPYLEEAQKIYTCFDRDKAGDSGHEKVAKSLGARVRQILMPMHGPNETKNDPSEWLIQKEHTSSEFTALVAAANNSLLVSVDEALSEWLSMEGNPVQNRISLGFDQLDSFIDGGVQNGQVVVVLARTGVGKTLFLVNMFHRVISADPTKKILFVSLEQTRNEWFDRALKVYSFYHDLAPRDPSELAEWQKVFNIEAALRGTVKHSLSKQNIPALVEMYRDNIMIVDRNKVTEEDIRICVEEFEDQMGSKPDMIAIDYLGYWARAFKGEGYERTTAAIMKLKELGKDIQVPIISPHQVNRGANDQRLDITSSRDSGAVEETADFLFALQRMAAPVADDRMTGMKSVDTGELVIDILKSRHGGKGNAVSFVDAPQSLAIVQKSDRQKTGAARQRSGFEQAETLNDFYLRRAADYYDLGDGNWRKTAFGILEDRLK